MVNSVQDNNELSKKDERKRDHRSCSIKPWSPRKSSPSPVRPHSPERGCGRERWSQGHRDRDRDRRALLEPQCCSTPIDAPPQESPHHLGDREISAMRRRE
ncbi:hypothetical protein DPMN_135228 [Dreissena polymorpha]|uniref:Uncharacterized protein n=1 Tax=Dreissena polymorpha TaxID=45954 RepID=A0A9D4JEG8_DREPO|nr:hypothetical protein DPMN_135228 [Dreissena polymorpha]